MPYLSLGPSERSRAQMAHWQYLTWVAYLTAVLSAWRFLPLAIVRLVAAFTRNETRHKQCMEVLRLARRDAARLSSYLPAPPRDDKPRKRRASLPGENS